MGSVEHTTIKINRQGTVREYKKGHIYLTHVEWEDGHVEIEVHRCVPEPLFHSCDPDQLELAFDSMTRHVESDLQPQERRLIIISR